LLVSPDFQGWIRCVRRFGCPSGLHADDLVELVIEGAESLARIWLNDFHLDADPTDDRFSFRLDIRNKLLPRNVLALEFALPGCPHDGSQAPKVDRGTATAWQEVRLEIHAARGEVP
jgi:hypothetical protein